MSGLANPRKDYRYVLELDGINMFLIQDVQTPEVEYQVDEHGAPINIPNAKTPGKMRVGEMVVQKLMPALSADTWAWDWFGAALSGIKKDFIKTGVLRHVGPDGFSTLDAYFLGDIWPSKIGSSNLVAAGSGNIIETVTFQTQFYFNQNSPLLQALLAGSAASAGGAGFLSGRETN